LALLPLNAYPAGLGKLTVTSSLGQPLRAEIEVIADSNEDPSAITARMAAADAFKDARIERASVLSSIRFSIEKRANGEIYLKLSSAKPVDEPFLDMLIELNWASGRLLREYTVLLDPPGFAEQQPVAPVAVAVPSVPRQPAAPAAREEAVPAKPAPAAKITATEAKPAKAETKPAPAAVAKPEPEQAKPAAAQPDAGEDTYGPVKKGDTLAQIATDMLDTSLKPEGISLEQMLVGLYERNKSAFVGNNMNRLKTGQILHIPETGNLVSMDRKEASRQIKLHAADWNAYRQKLAAAVGAAAPEKGAAAQMAAGRITPRVEEKAATKQEPAKDVLKLSKGEAVAAGKAETGAAAKGMQDRIRSLEEEATAREKTVREANERITALEKNIKEMQQLLEIKNRSLAELQSQAAAKPQAPAAAPPPVPVPAPVAEVKPPEVKPQPEPKPVPPSVKKPKPAVVAPPPVPEAAWYDDLLSNPLVLGGCAAAVLLGGLLWLMAVGKRRRKSLTTFEDSIMTGGDLKANTVFGEASGGVIDTGDTSFLTDFSQAGLGTIDTNDVDPIAEAEVYMAYGRDAQAEEILKEAMHKDPDRHEIQVKLLEIYAGRKNVIAFETLASELYAAVGGKASPLWEKVAEMGRQLDPDNPLYSGGGPAATFAETPAAGRVAAVGAVTAAAVAAAAVAAGLLEEPEEVPAPAAAAEPEEIPEELAPEDMEFNLELPAAMEAGNGPVLEEAAREEALEFDLDFAVSPSAAPEVPAEPTPTAEEGFDSDMGLTLDLDTIIPQAVEKQMMQERAAPEPQPETSELDQELAFDLVGEQDLRPVGEAAAQVEQESAPELAQSEVAPEPEIVFEAPQESPLDFDFGLDEEESPAVAAPGGEISRMDFSGLSLDLDEAPMAAGEEIEAAEVVDDQWHQVSTKLDLAKAYIDMGDKEGAREILQEVLQEGDQQQQDDAKALVSSL
jgi:pilus assembly protein FimV